MIEQSNKRLEEMIEQSNKRLEEMIERYNKRLDEMIERNNKRFEENKRQLEEIREDIERNSNLIDRLNNIDKSSLNEVNSNEIEELEIDDKMIENILINKDKCIICLNNYIIHDKISYLSCLHLFHSRCIKEWLKISNKCPLCKNRVNQ